MLFIMGLLIFLLIATYFFGIKIALITIASILFCISTVRLFFTNVYDRFLQRIVGRSPEFYYSNKYLQSISTYAISVCILLTVNIFEKVENKHLLTTLASIVIMILISIKAINAVSKRVKNKKEKVLILLALILILAVMDVFLCVFLSSHNLI
ncbi:hypothetical protein [Clostridium tetani]|uniref:Uncharacterized protein n=2 Tax=Clostridium tetani TaxID=1513 RepID=A0ABY0EPJ6_CLOTA|nr:hypothetical protein [Clostridium tetani]CDI49676.1 hypothetical protein BN906_01679 [Clostridium tetani 12124569]KHO39034.1 hypothetical protein OR62_08125 [Clostridium tetani]RXI38059.1 hypothetical protein DP129_11955 [Clostridium tetani]RXI52385.1 hypothetical protein DP131_12670 [Clostridium tetani]RXI70024.1 hypothetical protein DQN76_07360 [Clostridium tetani]